MIYKLEKKCHAWMGIWWQIKQDKQIIFKSKIKKDCVNFLNNKINFVYSSINLKNKGYGNKK
jgi:hypothetical protein